MNMMMDGYFDVSAIHLRDVIAQLVDDSFNVVSYIPLAHFVILFRKK